MGKLVLLDVKGLASIQDEGRYGYRQYGIPQSGAMDRQRMHLANQLVKNAQSNSVVELGMGQAKWECLEDVEVAVVGDGAVQVNGVHTTTATIHLKKGDQLEIGFPDQHAYTYLAFRGLIKAKNDFESYSTYASAGFGGLDGNWLKKGDVLEILSAPPVETTAPIVSDQDTSIPIMRGPEWHLLKDLPTNLAYQILPDSNRMGIRLSGKPISCEVNEIRSSAVVPGTIQLLPNGQLIVLMNDCQTMGGYPRVGTVLQESLGKLAQLFPGRSFNLIAEL